MTESEDKDKEAAFGFIVDKAMQYGKEIDEGLHVEPYAYEIKQARADFKSECEYLKREETEVERLCDKIKGIKPIYEMTFEEYWKALKECDRIRNEEMHHEMYGDKILHKQPIGMTSKQWTEAKRKLRRQQKEDNAKRRADQAIERTTPIRLFDKKLTDMYHACYCDADEMRQGIFCDICKIVLKIDEHAMTLLRREAVEV
jgi:hypothetical protein